MSAGYRESIRADGVVEAYCNLCGRWNNKVGIFRFGSALQDYWICPFCLSEMARDVEKSKTSPIREVRKRRGF
jgi:hypothetical protein